MCLFELLDMGTRAHDVSTLITSRAALGTWARCTLRTLEIPDAGTTIRLRWVPNPLPGQAFAAVTWDPVRAADELEAVIEARLAELPELPESASLRLEVLNGTGEALPGLTTCARWRPGMPPTATASVVPATASRSEAIDAEWSESMPGNLATSARGAMAMAGEMAGDAMVTLPAKALIGIFLFRESLDFQERQQLRGATLAMAGESRLFADVVRRTQLQGLDHIETSYALLLDRTAEAAKAPAEIELAKERATANSAPTTPAQQTIGMINSTANLLTALQGRKAAPAVAAAPAAAPTATPTTPTEPAPAPTTPAQAAEVPPAAAPVQSAPTVPAEAALLFDPSLPEEVVVALMESQLPPQALARIRKIAHTLVKNGGETK